MDIDEKDWLEIKKILLKQWFGQFYGQYTPSIKKKAIMKTVLITGASGGIGKEFATIFAQKNYNLVLVARGKDKLEQIKTDLENIYKIRVINLPFDLSKQNAAKNLSSEVKHRSIEIDILINNAGFGDYGYFMESDPAKTTEMINLNIVSLTELTALFVKEMLKKNSGKILNIASTAAFQPVPKVAAYSATKSYVLNFTEALHYELKKTEVSVSVLCPGPTSTGFKKSANMEGSNLFKRGVMNPLHVAKIGYKGLMKNKMTIIPGFKNKIMATLSNITPSRNFLVWISGKIS
jgi:short-subunit dehydrogenase